MYKFTSLLSQQYRQSSNILAINNANFPSNDGNHYIKEPIYRQTSSSYSIKQQSPYNHPKNKLKHHTTQQNISMKHYLRNQQHRQELARLNHVSSLLIKPSLNQNQTNNQSFYQLQKHQQQNIKNMELSSNLIQLEKQKKQKIQSTKISAYLQQKYGRCKKNRILNIRENNKEQQLKEKVHTLRKQNQQNYHKYAISQKESYNNLIKVQSKIQHVLKKYIQQ